ncbi:MAG TPA: hypothetical protein DEP03_14200 [Massilia sp.]|nr:hypothetical protein [Massilia sp.]
MGIGPATTALIANLREWAADPGAWCYPVKTTRGRAVIFPEDVVGCTDEQLVALICARLNENK